MITKSQIQFVKSLRLKKFRQKYNQFVVEGEKGVAELLQSTLTVVQIYGTEPWRNEYSTLLKDRPVNIVKDNELERISNLAQPNKVLAIAEIPAQEFDAAYLEQPLTIALDFVQDPGNLGTIIRTADWYGIQHIICSENSVDVYNPKVINATMGSFARVQVHYVDLEATLTPYKKQLYACTMEGKPVYGIKTKGNKIIVIGNEGSGISEGLLQLAGHQISIPRRGKAESLNAAVASAIIVDNLAQTLP